MENKSTQTQELSQNQPARESLDKGQKKRPSIFNAGQIKPEYSTGVDHTITLGQNPLPIDDQNENVEWNKNEKVSDDQKMYAKKSMNNDQDQETDEITPDEEDSK